MSKFVAIGLLVVLGGLGAGFALLNRSESAKDAQTAAELARLEAERQLDHLKAAGTHTPGSASGVNPEALLAWLTERGLAGVSLNEHQAILTGRILKPSETAGQTVPVADAVVEFRRIHPDSSTDPTTVASATSRPDGRWFTTWGLDAGCSLTASAVGATSATLKLGRDQLAARLVDAGDLLLATPSTLTLKVTTGVDTLMEKVTPVEGFAVRAKLADGTVLGEGKTNAEGQFVFAELAGGAIQIEGELAPYASFSEKLTLTTPRQEHTVNLQLVGRVRVKVKAATGAALTAFAVSLDIQRDNYGWMMPKMTDISEVDREGFGLVEGVKVGKHDLYATAPGHAVGKLTPVDVKPGEVTDVEVTLPPGFPLEGTVVTKKDGTPIAGAIVFSEKDLLPSTVDTDKSAGFLPMARATKTDGQGRFKLEDLTEGSHQLSAIHPDFAEGTLQAAKVGKGLPPQEIVVKLSTGASLEGHTYDANGQISKGDQLMVIGIMDRNQKKKAPKLANSNEEGYYRIDHVPAGVRGVVRVAASATANEQKFDFKMQTVKDGEVTTLDFGERGQAAKVRGRVLDVAGKPVPDVTVSLSNYTRANAGIPEIYQGVVDATGQYEIHNVKPGTYAVQVAKAYKGSDFANVDDTVTVTGAEIVTKDITLDGGSLEGTVVQSGTGKPLEEGEVVLLVDGRTFAGRAELDRGGKFSIPHVAPGEYALVASAKDHGNVTRHPVSVARGEKTTIPPIELQGGGRIVGSVQSAAGQPLVGARINLIDAQSGETIPAWSFGSGEDGTFTAEYVPAGNYRVQAVLAGHSFEPVPTTVEVGGTATVTLRAQ